ncbi:MAG: GH25 family lysozyme [Chloroflexota bacterium]
MTVLGIDISKWNGNWDAAKTKAAGASFVFMKASQAKFTDPLFSANWVKAKAVGLLRGAYHYLDYTQPGRDQANYFADLLSADRGELSPVVDFEQRRSDKNTDLARSYLRDFVEQLGARGYTPIIYTGPSFWNEYGSKEAYWAQFPLWIAHYTTSAAPTLPPPWPRWTFWQFIVKGNGAVFGTESLDLDMNRFDGTMDDLYTFAGLETEKAKLANRVATMEYRVATMEQRLGITPAQAVPVSYLPAQPASPYQPVTQAQATIVSTPAPQQAGSVQVSYSAAVTASGLNVRSGPGTAFPVIGWLSKGQRVKVIETQNGWSRVETPVGWCASQYLDTNLSEPIQAPQPTAPSSAPVQTGAAEAFAICTANGLNIRNGPGTNYPVVGWLTNDQRIKVIERQNGWARIEHPAGWSSERYLSFTNA